MNKKNALRVDHLMSTKLIVFRENDTISQAVREMRIAAIRHVPVVDSHGRLRGLLSSHDLMSVAVDGAEAPLASIMTTSVKTVSPDTPAYEAVGMLIDHKINALPVVGLDGTVVGIVTATDFLVVAHQALCGEAVTREVAEV
jgi:CBS domain-containing protein